MPTQHKNRRRTSKKPAVPIDEVLRKKANHLLKLLHKEVKKAKQFEMRKVMRRIKEAKEKLGPEQAKAAPSVDLQKLEAQLVAARSMDVGSLSAEAAASTGISELAAARDGDLADGSGSAPPPLHKAAQQVVHARILGAKCVTSQLVNMQQELERVRTQAATRAAVDAAADGGGGSDDALVPSDKPASQPQKRAKHAQKGQEPGQEKVDVAAFEALDKLRQRRTVRPSDEVSSSDDSGMIDAGSDDDVIDLSIAGTGTCGEAKDSDGSAPLGQQQQQAWHGLPATKRHAKAKAQPKRKKNRLGQRARKLAAERLHGVGAVPRHSSKVQHHGNAGQGRRVSVAAAPSSTAEQELHPSWAAKRKQGALLVISKTQPAARKIRFDDGEEDNGVRAGSGKQLQPRVAVVPEAKGLHPSWEEAKRRKAEQMQQLFQPKGIKITFDDSD